MLSKHYIGFHMVIRYWHILCSEVWQKNVLRGADRINILKSVIQFLFGKLLDDAQSYTVRKTNRV